MSNVDHYSFWDRMKNICDLLDFYDRQKPARDKLMDYAKEEGLEVDFEVGELPQVLHMKDWVRRNAVPAKLTWKQVLQVQIGEQFLSGGEAQNTAKKLGYRYYVWNGRVQPTYDGCWKYMSNGGQGPTLEEVGLEDPDDGVGRSGGDEAAPSQ